MKDQDKNIILKFGNKLTEKTNELREYQSLDGTIKNNINEAISLIEEIKTHLQDLGKFLNLEPYTENIVTDINNWLQAGIDSIPNFSNTRDNMHVPDDQQWVFFWGPYMLANSLVPKGYKVECFITFRDEPKCGPELYKKYPHPKNICLSTRILTGSKGFLTGNCIVFFPENIKCDEKFDRQQFALFFFNKFRNIYLDHTIPKANKLISPPNSMLINGKWQSEELSLSKFYEARCVWGYFHDYYHHLGPRPFDEHVYVKLKWHVGLLEEIKVDSQVVLKLYEDNSIPFRREIMEFVILERLFRYPDQPDAEINFDSGTGVFLMEWLIRHNALKFDLKNHTFTFSEEKLLDALDRLVVQVLKLETLSDEQYVLESQKLVESVIGEGGHDSKFKMPDYQKSLFSDRTAANIDFNSVEMY